MKHLFIPAIIAWALLCSPALAEGGYPFALPMSGGQFVSLCTDPPSESGGQIAAMCQMYVMGIADVLKADNRICFGSWLPQRKLFATAAWWIDSRPRETFPVSVMVRNGLLAAFPCSGQNRSYVAQPDYRLQQAEKFTRLLALAKDWLSLFGIK